jgi:membrane-associated phospholipid phosphatase
VAERSNAAVSKTVSGLWVRRGFKSLPLRSTRRERERGAEFPLIRETIFADHSNTVSRQRHIAFAAAALFAAACPATYVFAVGSTVGNRADAAIDDGMTASRLNHVRHLTHYFRPHVLNIAGLAAIVGAVVVLSLVLFVRREPRRGGAVLVLLVASLATTELLKPLLGPIGRTLDPGRRFTDSYPSGHATLVMAALLAAVIAAPIRWRTTVSAIAVFVATVSALVIVAAGLHPPSDVAGGYLMAGAWAALLTAILGEGRAGTALAQRRKAAVTLAALTALVCVLALTVFVAFHSGDATLGRRHALPVATLAFAAITATIVTTIAALRASPRLQLGHGCQSADLAV